MRSLPTELWDLIVDLLPQCDQRTCLLLSRLHHDLAFPKLFSHVTASFGMWMWMPWTAEEEPIDPSNVSRMTHLNNNTRDLLRAIPRHPGFSQAVKCLTVQAYAWGNGKELYEQHSLIAALETLSNLRTFRWYDENPMPSSAILKALERGSSTTLAELHIPMLQSMATILPRALNFPSLKALSLVFPDSSAEVGLDACDSDAINRLLDAVAPALTRLSISGDAIWRRESFGSFLALQELELIYVNAFSGIHNILCQCGAVTSLTILPGFASHPDEMFAALDAYRHTLPRLTAFKYLNHMMVEIVEEQHIHALCKFLQNKTLLRRLDVSLDVDEKMEVPLLELLPSLPALEVLGFDFVRYEWTPEDVLFFERVIPARISALSLQPDTYALRLYAPYKEAWLKLFESRAALRYLHIFETAVTSPDPPGTVETNDSAGLGLGLRFHPLSAEELPGSLELFGYGVYLRPVVREPRALRRDARSDAGSGSGTSGEPGPGPAPPLPLPPPLQTFGPCWSREKVMFRTAEDFAGCPDWEWLLRWRDFGGLGALRPGVLKNGV